MMLAWIGVERLPKVRHLFQLALILAPKLLWRYIRNVEFRTLYQRMILDSRNADALRRMMINGSSIKGRLEAVTAFTLPGTMEVLASVVDSNHAEALRKEVERHTQNYQQSPVTRAFQGWYVADSVNLDVDMHGIRRLEFYRLRTRADQTELAYQLYQERFVRSLKRLGDFPPSFARALAGALVEMTDNVVQHSEAEPVTEFTGLAGYHVDQRYMCFAVIDVGQGVLASLRRSAAWKHIQTAERALRAAVCDYASSRPGEPHGDGFRTLFRNLADRNCRLRFRSGNAVLTVEDLGAQREGVFGTSPPLNGLQLSVCCSLAGKAEEQSILSVDSLI